MWIAEPDHVGPSPRAWGLRVRLAHPEEFPRAIPTCVGTTVWGVGSYSIGNGPSPRAWGLHQPFLDPLVAGRAIPTCVGTTSCRGRWPGSGLGHPHVRGDYAAQMCRAPSELGPSPRAWGLPTPWIAWPSGSRAIPTCVGTTTQTQLANEIGTGHPHVRGDYWVCSVTWVLGIGPSPRAWGLRSSHPLLSTKSSGHPHVRGDYDRTRCPDSRQRAIPTCVGTTQTETPPVVVGDGPSPRAWGLPKSYSTWLTAYLGPSPRAWGLRSNSSIGASAKRAIPTCVGTTHDPDGKNPG